MLSCCLFVLLRLFVMPSKGGQNIYQRERNESLPCDNMTTIRGSVKLHCRAVYPPAKLHRMSMLKVVGVSPPICMSYHKVSKVFLCFHTQLIREFYGLIRVSHVHYNLILIQFEATKSHLYRSEMISCHC